MDPNEAWSRLVFAHATDNREEAAEYYEALRGWLSKDGFLPSEFSFVMWNRVGHWMAEHRTIA